MRSVLKLLFVFCCVLVNVSSFAALPIQVESAKRQRVVVELPNGSEVDEFFLLQGPVITSFTPKEENLPVAQQDSSEPENTPSTPILCNNGPKPLSHWPFLDSALRHTSR